ncbi:hypothetical protein EMCG_02799 [[Emmonsia] crescens]|uniref:Uncharacterized protein n=1 Tax=[Emmonsia] crescens TaxID=73230 RepID=A0A0G2HYH9_9EURO|nr:hypothetical protein EMCG_02799 [Emmonsia crescens UAMH 3008]
MSFRTCRNSSNTTLDCITNPTRNPDDLTDSQSVQLNESDAVLSQGPSILGNDSSFPSEIKEQLPSVKAQPSSPVSVDIPCLPRTPKEQGPYHHRDILDQLFHKLIPKLDRVSEERFEARSQRYELKNKREELLDTGTELMQRLHEVFAKADPCIAKPLVGLFERYQQEQHTYLALEDDYRELEDDLILQEYQLEKVQSKLSKAFHRANHPSERGTSTDTDDFDDDSSSSEVSFGLIETKTYHPLMTQYLSLLGKHSLLSEELFNLRSRRQALLSEKAARGNFRPTLDDESETFLELFEVLEKELIGVLDSLKENSRRIYQECRDQGLSLPGDGDGSEAKDLALEPAHELRNNSLLECKMKELSLFSEADSIQAHGPFNIVEYINKWLLHQLRLSGFEMLRYKLTTGFDIKEVDEQTFYDCWFNDETATQRMTPPMSWENFWPPKALSSRSSRSEPIPVEHLSPGSASSFNQDTEPQSYVHSSASRQRDTEMTAVPPDDTYTD